VKIFGSRGSIGERGFSGERGSKGETGLPVKILFNKK
jgi:hypothetical protein